MMLQPLESGFSTALTPHTRGPHVYGPLSASQGANHGNPETQAAQEQLTPAHLLDDAAHGGGLVIVQTAHQVVPAQTCLRKGRTVKAARTSITAYAGWEMTAQKMPAGTAGFELRPATRAGL